MTLKNIKCDELEILTSVLPLKYLYVHFFTDFNTPVSFTFFPSLSLQTVFLFSSSLP